MLRDAQSEILYSPPSLCTRRKYSSSFSFEEFEKNI